MAFCYSSLNGLIIIHNRGVLASVMVRLGRHKRNHRLSSLDNRNLFTSDSSEGWEVPGEGPEGSAPGESLLLICRWLPPLCPHTAEGQLWFLSLPFLIRAPILCWGLHPHDLNPNKLPYKGPTSRYHHTGESIPTYEFSGGTNSQSIELLTINSRFLLCKPPSIHFSPIDLSLQ